MDRPEMILTVPDEEAPTRSELWDRAMSAVGSFDSDGANVSEEHDRYLDDAYGSGLGLSKPSA